MLNLRPSVERCANIGCCDHHNACVGFLSRIFGTIWTISTKIRVNIMSLALQDTAKL
jgi:hypothetical protein